MCIVRRTAARRCCATKSALRSARNPSRFPTCHCEERNDEAIQIVARTGLLRFARNDDSTSQPQNRFGDDVLLDFVRPAVDGGLARIEILRGERTAPIRPDGRLVPSFIL